MGPAPEVAVGTSEARRVLDRGGDVVVVVAPGDVGEAAAEVVELRAGGPGRLAVMVGDPADPGVLAAAAEMAVELFAGRVTGDRAPGSG